MPISNDTFTSIAFDCMFDTPPVRMHPCMTFPLTIIYMIEQIQNAKWHTKRFKLRFGFPNGKPLHKHQSTRCAGRIGWKATNKRIEERQKKKQKTNFRFSKLTIFICVSFAVICLSEKSSHGVCDTQSANDKWLAVFQRADVNKWGKGV